MWGRHSWEPLTGVPSKFWDYEILYGHHHIHMHPTITPITPIRPNKTPVPRRKRHQNPNLKKHEGLPSCTWGIPDHCGERCHCKAFQMRTTASFTATWKVSRLSSERKIAVGHVPHNLPHYPSNPVICFIPAQKLSKVTGVLGRGRSWTQVESRARARAATTTTTAKAWYQ